MTFLKSLRAVFRTYCKNTFGAAAAELALVLPLLTIPTLNVIDLASYFYDKMQLDNAAQAAAQSAWTTCAGSSTNLPATVNCSGLSSAATAAAQSTGLGAGVTITSKTENFYCLNNSSPSVLVTVGTFPTSKPADCSSVQGGSTSDTPGDYILIQTSYTFTPIFSSVSITGFLTSPIVRTAWMRLG